MWHRTAPALDPGGTEPKPTLSQSETAEVTLFVPEMGKPGLLGVRPEGPSRSQTGPASGQKTLSNQAFEGQGHSLPY